MRLRSAGGTPPGQPAGRRRYSGTRAPLCVTIARMALGATMFSVIVDLSDIDRGVYERLDLRVARHPSETDEQMMMRIIAYALEYTEGIELTRGVSSGDEPAILIRDLTGRITGWIEVGLPGADRLHRGSKAAERVAVYTNRIALLFEQLAGKRIHRASEIPLHELDRAMIMAAAGQLERRTEISLSVTEQHLYLTVNGRSFESLVQGHRMSSEP